VNTAVALTTDPEKAVPPLTVSGRMLSVAPSTGLTRTLIELPQSPFACAVNFRPTLLEAVDGFSGVMTTRSRPAFRAWPGAADNPTLREEGSYHGIWKTVGVPPLGPIGVPLTTMFRVGAGAVAGTAGGPAEPGVPALVLAIPNR